MIPHDIIAGYMAGLTQQADWRKEARVPVLPDNRATHLIALLHRAGFAVVPYSATAQMEEVGDPDIWRVMVEAWEKELKEAQRAGAIDFFQYIYRRKAC